MKEWLLEHKLAAISAIIVIFGVGYYLYNGYSRPTELNMPESSGIDQKQDESSSKTDTQKVAQPEALMVDVKGQVKQPGVYAAAQGERVIDVINRAGGPTEQADETQVNFAEHVQDEMVIYIPAKGEAGQVLTGESKSPGESTSAKVNINTADTNQLQTLPGIGPAKAAAIIEYRETSGPFKTPEDLKNISGIGDKTFAKLKDLVELR
jgi:competence protein ComEA